MIRVVKTMIEFGNYVNETNFVLEDRSMDSFSSIGESNFGFDDIFRKFGDMFSGL